MRYKAIWKDTFREILKSKMRFLAILVIIFLGVGFYVGLSATSPNMMHTANNYFTENNLMDYRIFSTYGLTDEDMDELAAAEGFEAQGRYAQDFFVTDYAQTIRLYSYDMKNGQDMNRYQLNEGRLPEASGEIAIDDSRTFLQSLEIGDTITLETGEDVGAPEDNLTTETFEVVGFVDSPLYINNATRGFTNIASGTLDGFGVIPEEDYDTAFYSEAYLTTPGADDFQTYSNEYEDYIAKQEMKLNPVIEDLEERRTENVQAEIKAEIADGWAEIDEGEQELANAEQELADARAELDEGWLNYEDGVAELEAKTADARQEIIANEEQLDQTIRDLEAERANLVAQRQQLETELSNLDGSEEELAAGQEQLGSGIEQIDAGLAEIESNRVEIEAGLAQIKTQREELLATKAQLEQLLEMPEADSAEIEAQIAEIDVGLDGLDAAEQEGRAPIAQEQELLAQRSQLQNQLEELKTQGQQLQDGRAQLIDGIQQINNGLTQLDNGLAEANAGYGELEAARNTLATETENARAELADAETELNEAEQEYADGLTTFEKERETALADLEEGRAELEEAEVDLENLPMPEYSLTTRSDSSDYMEYLDNADRLSIIAAVFPLFFFLIAIFISFTTMTRMVDEEREYIGIMKALGYSNRHILIKFITYSILATTVGAVLGLFAGYTFIPELIFFAYSAMYNFPDQHIQQYTLYTAIALIASYLSTVGASLIAVKNSLRSNAARLLQPKAPKHGTHIWLEKIPFIWEKLSFNYKITFRNVFRYKSRMFMTIFGIAGSTGLVLTGFGISDSISSIPDTQYGEVNQFQAYVALNTNVEQNEFEQYLDAIQNEERIDHSLLVAQESVTAEAEGVNSQDVNFFIPNEPERIDDFVNLRDFESDEVYSLDNSGAYITQKLARLFDKQVGDDMTVLDPDDNEWTFEIAGIVENYVGHTIYTSPPYFEEITGADELDLGLQLIKYNPEEVTEQDLGRDLLTEEAVIGVTYTSDVYDAFSKTLYSLGLITQILVIAAAALAFIVLYNLTNINVSERERELSTIKVLGFHPAEVTMYIYRENIILTLIGIFFGLVFGTVLQRFIMTTMEVDQLVFGKVIHLSSYVYSSLLTIFFSVVVMLVIHRQLKRIDMVEALKAND